MPYRNRRNNNDKQPDLATKVALLDNDFRLLKSELAEDRKANAKNWENFYIFKEELIGILGTIKKPSSFKDIIIAIGSTLTVVTVVVGGVLAIIDSRIAVPVEQGKTLSLKVDELTSRQNELVNLIALQSAKLSTVTEKGNSNTDFVTQYQYIDKIPSALTAMQKDIEFIKIKERRK